MNRKIMNSNEQQKMRKTRMIGKMSNNSNPYTKKATTKKKLFRIVMYTHRACIV